MTKQQSRALRILACAVVMVLCFVIESSFSVRLSVLGAHFDFLPPIIASAAVCLGCPAGLVCGALAGILYDASGVSVEGLFPLYYMIWGIFCGMAGEKYRTRRLNYVVLLSVGMTLLLSLIRYLFYFQFVTDASVIFFIKGMVAQALLTALLSPLVYWFISRIAGQGPQRLKKRERRKERIDGQL